MKHHHLLTLIVVGMLTLTSCHSGKGGLSEELKSLIKNPEYTSKDGRLIIGFSIPKEQLDPHYRGEGGMQAVYEGDPIPEEFYDH